MLDKINFGGKISNSKIDLPKETVSSNNVSFQDIVDDKLACLKKKETEQMTKEIRDVPEYYYSPNVINVVKYGLPSEDIVRPMYAIPSPNIEKDEKEEEPPVLKYAVPPIKSRPKEEEPPLLKYAVPNNF